MRTTRRGFFGFLGVGAATSALTIAGRVAPAPPEIAASAVLRGAALEVPCERCGGRMDRYLLRDDVSRDVIGGAVRCQGCGFVRMPGLRHDESEFAENEW